MQVHLTWRNADLCADLFSLGGVIISPEQVFVHSTPAQGARMNARPISQAVIIEGSLIDTQKDILCIETGI
jgi:hypothetical protein